MAAIKIREFRSIVAANFFLSGGVVGGVPVPSHTKYRFQDLVGKTLTFTSPAGSKTFTQPAGLFPGELTFQDVKSQLEGAIANLRVLLVEGQLAFQHATAGTVVSLASANEPARPILGFPNNVGISGVALADPGGSAPKFISLTVKDGAFFITSQE